MDSARRTQARGVAGADGGASAGCATTRRAAVANSVELAPGRHAGLDRRPRVLRALPAVPHSLGQLQHGADRPAARLQPPALDRRVERAGIAPVALEHALCRVLVPGDLVSD